MYHRLLTIALIGLNDDVAQAVEAVEAPARFSLEFARYDKVPEGAGASSVVIVAAAAASAAELQELSAANRAQGGFHEIALVATAEELAALTADQLGLVDFIWPAPITPAVATFEFRGTVNRAARHAEVAVNDICYNTIINSIPAMIWIKANDGEHTKVNDYFCDIVEKPKDDVEGQFHNYIWNVPPEDWEKAELTCKESDDAAVEAGETVRCDENVSTHGEIRLFDTYKTPIYDEDGTVLGTTGFAHDITLERELKQLAWHNARTDYLTGLYNRRYFYEFLEEHADEAPMTFVLVDLDNFKGINDGGGHDEGDNALLVTTSALEKCFPDCPIVRWGGDEFVVVVPHTKDDLVADSNMELFQRTLNEWTEERCPFMLTASMGIAAQEGDEDVDATVKRADDALYAAKEAGKARFVRSGNA